jgi:hypothetical protein
MRWFNDEVGRFHHPIPYASTAGLGEQLRESIEVGCSGDESSVISDLNFKYLSNVDKFWILLESDFLIFTNFDHIYREKYNFTVPKEVLSEIDNN